MVGLDWHLRRALHRALDAEGGGTPDNSRAEGFFGRLKVEFFYGRGWNDASMGEFIEMLDAYLVWYRDGRRKSDLGYKSPMQYRRNLGFVA